jgi:hypothetical protein
MREMVVLTAEDRVASDNPVIMEYGRAHKRIGPEDIEQAITRLHTITLVLTRHGPITMVRTLPTARMRHRGGIVLGAIDRAM